MGLIDGRGRWIRMGRRRTVDDMLRLNAHQVMTHLPHVQGWAGAWRWSWRTWRGPQTAVIDLAVTNGERARLSYNWQGQPVQPYTVAVAKTHPPFGGVRYWWLCPHCGRRVADLYGGRLFLCRQCHGLTYPTAQAGSADVTPSVQNRLRVLRKRLAIDDADDDSRLPGKPVKMRWRTYERLEAEYLALAALADQVWLVKLYAVSGLRQRKLQERARWLLRQARQQQGLAGGLYPELAQWVEETDDPIIAAGRERRRQEAQAALAELERTFCDPDRLTLGELAAAAGVPYAFAVEAQAEGLLRPDGGRGTRTKRYRRRLASWLVKLAGLRAEGHSWADLRAWARRRWQPGHEDERRAPAPVRDSQSPAAGAAGLRGGAKVTVK